MGNAYITEYQYLWKESAVNIELKLNRFLPVWQEEHAKLQEVCYIKLRRLVISPYCPVDVVLLKRKVFEFQNLWAYSHRVQYAKTISRIAWR